MSIFDTPISAFKTAQDTVPVTVTLRAFLHSKKHLPEVLRLRAEADADQRTKLKKRLPAATISGTFVRRSIQGIAEYNGLVCLDFDAKENPALSPQEMKTMLSDIDEVAYAGISVSGMGVYAIVPTDNASPDMHSATVEILGKAVERIGLVYDRACKDVSRLRFISYDESPYINEAASLFEARRLIEKINADADRPPRPIIIRKPRTDQPNYDDTRSRVEQYLDAIDGSCVDITDNYDDWYRIGFAFAQEFGMDGEYYFKRVSQWNPKYNESETEKKYKNLLTSGRRVGIGTFFKICKMHGIAL
jgi:hypothetical protein